MRKVIKLLRWILIKAYNKMGFKVAFVYVVYSNKDYTFADFVNETRERCTTAKITLRECLNSDIANAIKEEVKYN